MSAILNSIKNLASSSKTSAAGDTNARFNLAPCGSDNLGEGEGGFAEWLHAMRLVARLPAGVPQHFRKKLWLTLSDRHLTARGIDWPSAERSCFRGTAQPDDTELGAQILKDLHRTGCSLFCGTEGRENQAMLRRVLLAYARWNKDVGYCQGFNMLAAIILEVMDKSESDSLKVMIYLVEAVLPEGYFADDLRGLSADMAAFRDLLRLRLPKLAQHMDHLQKMSDGGGVEPPLPDVFTMQWFLTLYATWLPRECLLRIWDLVLLDGNEVLLLTALAIWDLLQDRILSARSADEYYSCMGGGASAVWEAGEALVARVVAFEPAPELPRLRSLHRYRVTPPAPPSAPPNYHPPLQTAVQSMTRRGLRLFYSEDEGDSSDDGNRMALATVVPRREERIGAGDRLTLDIGALKRQYERLRERQRQAHVILAAACARHAAVGVSTSPTSLTVNNLLLGKSAIVSSRGRRLGPPPGAVPPSRQTSSTKGKPTEAYETISWNEEKCKKSLSRRNSVKWKDIKKDKDLGRKASIDFDEAGDGLIVSETEANEIIATVKSRSGSESSTYSSRSESSSDTSLCDENEKDSESDLELPVGSKDKPTELNYLSDTKESSKIVKDSLNILTSPISPSINNLFPAEKNVAVDLDNVITKENQTLNTMRESSFSPGFVEEAKMYALSPSPQHNKIAKEVSVTDISEFIQTAAGEPLRNYIGCFENKSDKYYKYSSDTGGKKQIYTDMDDKDDNDFLRLNKMQSKVRGNPINITDLSPIDLSPPCDFPSPIELLDPVFNRPPTFRTDLSARPPDLIDTFAMYPNFVPDIDLSEKKMSCLESPPKSPGAESIAVSEDEHPIPLKIDKYFEHSPDFFGARITVTDKQNLAISSRRPSKRQIRIPKKPDSLTLQCNHNERLNIEDERASSLPQNFTSSKVGDIRDDAPVKETTYKVHIEQNAISKKDSFSPKQEILASGRKNSERALEIIQENSKILSRILTKQNNDLSKKIVETKPKDHKAEYKYIPTENIESPVLKESTSDSLIGCKKWDDVDVNKTDITRSRPLSMDVPFVLESGAALTKINEFLNKNIKSPSIECLANKTDYYGWENKGFLAKCDFNTSLTRDEFVESKDMKSDVQGRLADIKSSSPDWSRHSFSGESRSSVTFPSKDKEYKETCANDAPIGTDDYSYSIKGKYDDLLLTKASDICRKTMEQETKVCENFQKTDSQVSEFANIVTSSISFTYEPTAEDESPTGAKSNSSDTLCQITSLDQVSTPISPKIFPRDTPRDFLEKSDRLKLDTDDTCSTITSLMETDTLSSLSYPRSPSTGSYHPFPTRPLRMPKELGVRLGMYPKDTISSSPK